MILADTSVWIDHLRQGDDGLATLLDCGQVLMHPFILGEVALGTLRQRRIVLDALGDLPRVTVATDHEVLQVIDTRSLGGRGIGYIDAHLLASLLLTPGTTLWTRDKRLQGVAATLGLARG